MNTGTFELGRKGELVVLDGLRKIYRDVRDVPKDMTLQLEWCDIVIPAVTGLAIPLQRIEVKTERKHTGNLFFETISNAATNREGWAVTTKASELYYLFWESGVGYKIPQFQHVKFLFDYYKHGFEEKVQAKHEQANKTIGRLVPCQWLKGLHVGVETFNFNAQKQLVEMGELTE